MLFVFHFFDFATPMRCLRFSIVLGFAQDSERESLLEILDHGSLTFVLLSCELLVIYLLGCLNGRLVDTC